LYGIYESKDSLPLDGRVTIGSEGLVSSGDGDKPWGSPLIVAKNFNFNKETNKKTKKVCQWGHNCYRHKAFLRGEIQQDCWFHHPPARPEVAVAGPSSNYRKNKKKEIDKVIDHPKIDLSNLNDSMKELLDFIKEIAKGRKTLLCKNHVLKSLGMDTKGFKCYGKRCKFSHLPLNQSHNLAKTAKREFFDRIIDLRQGPAVITFIINYIKENFSMIESILEKISSDIHQKLRSPEISIKNWCILRRNRFREKNTGNMSVSEFIVANRDVLKENKVPEWIITFAQEQVRNLKFCNAWTMFCAKKMAGIPLIMDDICCAGGNCLGGIHVNFKKPVVPIKCYFTTNPDIDLQGSIEKVAEDKSHKLAKFDKMKATYDGESQKLAEWEKRLKDVESDSSKSDANIKAVRKTIPKRSIKRDYLLQAAIDIANTVHVPENYISSLDNVTRVADLKFEFSATNFPDTFGTNQTTNRKKFHKWNKEQAKILAHINKKQIAASQKKIKDDSKRQIDALNLEILIKRAKRFAKKLKRSKTFMYNFSSLLHKIRMRKLRKEAFERATEFKRIKNRKRRGRKRITEDPSAFGDNVVDNPVTMPADYIVSAPNVSRIKMGTNSIYDSADFTKALKNRRRKKKNILIATIKSLNDLDVKKDATRAFYEACYAADHLRSFYGKFITNRKKSKDMNCEFHFNKYKLALGNLERIMKKYPDFKEEIKEALYSLCSWYDKFNEMLEQVKKNANEAYKSKSIKKAQDSDSESDSESDSDSDSNSDSDSSDYDSDYDDDDENTRMKSGYLKASYDYESSDSDDDDDDCFDNFNALKELEKEDRRNLVASLDIVMESYDKIKKGYVRPGDWRATKSRKSNRGESLNVKNSTVMDDDKEEEEKIIKVETRKIVLSNLKAKKEMNLYNSKLKKKGHYTKAVWDGDNKTGEVFIVLRKNKTQTIVESARNMYDLFKEMFNDREIVVNVRELDSYVMNH
jgi:hypothetical protein